MAGNRGPLVLAACLLAGCGDSRLAIRTPVRHYELAPGEHRIGIDVPFGWTVVNQGDEIRIRRGTIEQGVQTIEIRDLGPAGLDGVAGEVERARELWSAGRDLDARWRLRRIDVPRDWFATASQQSGFWDSVHDLTGARRGAAYSEVEDGFHALIDSVRAIEPPTLEAAATSALSTIEDLANRREIGRRVNTTLDGHAAIVLETRYRLAHSDPRRYVVIRNQDRFLALWMDRSRSGRDDPAFDAIVQSLRLRPASGPI